MFSDFVTGVVAAEADAEFRKIKEAPDFDTTEEETDAVNRIPDLIDQVNDAERRAYEALSKDNYHREIFTAWNQARSWVERFPNESAFRDYHEPRHLRRFGFSEGERTIRLVNATLEAAAGLGK